ncbi:MAG: hypothetical protein AMJ56_10785 [Anaerolineae bacterium SG8_19]|jgi:hypothetical protein|nr:MAG: hypothetical protein AMJ56_10785 [Anaerolineae bacterium SG8_19]
MANQDKSSDMNIFAGEAALKPKSGLNAHERISSSSTMVEIVIIVVAFVLFNAFPERIGFITSFDPPLRIVPILAAEFQAHLPLLNLYWAFALALGFYKLQFLRWSPGMRLADFALTSLGIVVLYRLLIGGPILELGPAIDALPGLSAMNMLGLEDVSFFANSVLKVIIGISLVINAFSAIGKLYHILSEEVATSRSI